MFQSLKRFLARGNVHDPAQLGLDLGAESARAGVPAEPSAPSAPSSSTLASGTPIPAAKANAPAKPKLPATPPRTPPRTAAGTPSVPAAGTSAGTPAGTPAGAPSGIEAARSGELPRATKVLVESAFLMLLRARGLKSIKSLRLTRNSRVMVSFRGSEMRIHQGYLDAPPEVLDAVVRLVEARTAAARREAGKFVVANAPVGDAAAPTRRERTHPEDEAWSERLVAEHRRLNDERFGGTLAPIAVRVSRRMKSRLGHYSPAVGSSPAEIAISRRHIRRHGWAEALDTLVHEMVHQWQAETGAPLDHGPGFRRKAREVGIRPRARRPAG